MKRWIVVLTSIALSALPVLAQEAAPTEEIIPAAPAEAASIAEAPAPAAETAPEPAPAPRIAVLMPEQVDGDWYWFDAGAGQQHLAQNAFEKAVVNAGFEILDVANIGGRISWDELISPKTATAKGRELGADYVIAGKASASKASEGSAYGVNVIRARAEITARLVRVSDGKVLAVEDGMGEAGGQAVKTASQEAIKKASPAVARKLVAALRKAVETAPAPAAP
jgi:hypothetical protein